MKGGMTEISKIKTSIQRDEYRTMLSHAGPAHSLG